MLFIFDMGGVVTSTFQMDIIYKKLNITKADFFEICRLNNSNIWNELEIGKIDVNKFWEEFNLRIKLLQQEGQDKILPPGHSLSESCHIIEIKPVETDLFRLYFHPELNQKTVELIKALRKNHRVVCGTNTIQSHWENHLERGDYSYFDQTYPSNKTGFAKPDIKFFQTILEAEGSKATESFFVDDKEENCRAAASIGIKTKIMKNPDDLYETWIKYAE